MAALIRRITKNSASIIGSSHYSISPCNIATNNLASSLFSRRGITTRLFVGGLSFYTTEKALAEAFSQYGQVIQAQILHDRISKRSKGFGFVTYASEDEADKALTEMNGKQLDGRVIYVDYAKLKVNFKEDLPIARGPPDS